MVFVVVANNSTHHSARPGDVLFHKPRSQTTPGTEEHEASEYEVIPGKEAALQHRLDLVRRELLRMYSVSARETVCIHSPDPGCTFCRERGTGPICD